MTDLDQTVSGVQNMVSRTHVGQRSNNEDAVLCDESLNLCIVADGVGGHQAGEIASQITCDTLRAEVAGGATLDDAIMASHTAVMDAVASGVGREGMASTVVVSRQEGDAVSLAWVGDSRVYFWDGRLHLLTQDHSLVADLLARGEITIEEASSHPKRNVILQALGLEQGSPPTVSQHRFESLPRGVLLLCTDGLSDVVPPARISAILEEFESDLDAAAESLLTSAVDRGGKDNITLALVRIHGPLAGNPSLDADDLVWTYDPKTGEYEGLPEPASATLDDSVTQIRPRGEGSASTLPAVTSQPSRKGRSSRWLILLIMICAAVAAAWWADIDPRDWLR